MEHQKPEENSIEKVLYLENNCSSILISILQIDPDLPTKDDVFGKATALTLQYQEENEKMLKQLEDKKVLSLNLILFLSAKSTLEIAGQLTIIRKSYQFSSLDASVYLNVLKQTFRNFRKLGLAIYSYPIQAKQENKLQDQIAARRQRRAKKYLGSSK